MKLYLSSYRLGNKTEELRAMIPAGRIAYIPNALDFTGADPDRKKSHIERDMDSLRHLGLAVKLIDIRDYFANPELLPAVLKKTGAVFVSGGNVFVLRQAMKLSGFDIFLASAKERGDFLYAGSSAAGAVLAPDLRAYEIVDTPEAPYPGQDIIWEGLGLVRFAFMPHWQSDHPESAAIEKGIEYCRERGIPCMPVRDGEVIIMDTQLPD